MTTLCHLMAQKPFRILFNLPIKDPTKTRFLLLSVAGLLMWGALFDERMGWSFKIAACPSWCSYSWVRVPLNSQTFDSLQLRRPGPHIYIPQEQGGSVIPPGTGFPCCHLYNSQGSGGRNPPPCGDQPATTSWCPTPS
jgi:hypothetical protein